MNILVVGGHFYNKGAHLMMKAVVEELAKYPEHKLFLSPCAGTKEQIKNLGYNTIDYPFKHVTDYRGFEIFFRFGSILKYLRKQYRGEFPVDNIDAVIDISGFAYSDQWGKEAVKNVNKLINYFKKRNAKYIFLPQAFGPFSGKEIREQMKDVLKNSDLIIARDNNSYEMLLSLQKNEKIKLYPDITITIKDLEKRNEIFSNYSCIVPNERMLDQGREYWPEGEYLEYVKKAINKLLKETDHNIIILIHDKGIGDTNLANQLKSREYIDESRVKVHYEEDTMKLKFILGKANLVIGSRFHALVSALSQNVPSMALGWSHKYKMLFEEYSVEDFSFDKPNDQMYSMCLENLLKEEPRKIMEDKIRASNLVQQRKNKQMWSEVIEVINS
ncbi:polysaccharide pyruvyl transferase family protein [Aquimarina sp. RZ0]|uniref:polysaccharide pyruvyl transferase family protein n=1 Tax=Aquimarina sp. RZ0 TaxID=2607730 RepID=UPI0011F10AEE|nr:polysaccharide pyruvyl transferase family protein [Aquimarina sp. RZ0]KAA1244325.1 polysaccharide pyruvyl transferase family protein [Aquimarina sp. RZ0]